MRQPLDKENVKAYLETIKRDLEIAAAFEDWKLVSRVIFRLDEQISGLQES